jgi:hypothetical protein
VRCLVDHCLSFHPCSGVFFNEDNHYLKIVVPVNMFWFPQLKPMRDDLSEISMVDYIQIDSYKKINKCLSFLHDKYMTNILLFMQTRFLIILFLLGRIITFGCLIKELSILIWVYAVSPLNAQH